MLIMKKKNIVLKIIFIILIFISVSVIMSQNLYAWNMHLDKYEKADTNYAGKAGGMVTNVVGAVIQIAYTVGAGVAIIMLIVIGIQYLSAGAEGKAEAKKDLSGYITGAIILFGVSGILRILQMFIQANLK